MTGEVSLMIISERIIKVLKERNMTQAEFAKQVGISTSTISEWKKIYCRTSKKLLYALTFPFFMLTYVPISIIALFKKVHWEPIKHTHSTTLTDICSENHDDQNQVNEKKDSVSSK